ncbi:hypothetical protein G6F57_018092 [Rhizopus arrhizus]|nr:hypothetical protein G6F57_018092 [Rhizopus arrhizus]
MPAGRALGASRLRARRPPVQPGARLERGRGADRAYRVLPEGPVPQGHLCRQGTGAAVFQPAPEPPALWRVHGRGGRAGPRAGPVDVVVHHQCAAGCQCDQGSGPGRARAEGPHGPEVTYRCVAAAAGSHGAAGPLWQGRGHHHPSGPVPGHGHPREAAARVQPRHAAGDAGADRIEPVELSGPGGRRARQAGAGHQQRCRERGAVPERVADQHQRCLQRAQDLPDAGQPQVCGGCAPVAAADPVLAHLAGSQPRADEPRGNGPRG